MAAGDLTSAFNAPYGLQGTESSAVLVELRKILRMLEALAQPRDYETKVIAVPDPTGRAQNAPLLDEVRRKYPDWELEFAQYEAHGLVSKAFPDGRWTTLWLRRPKYVEYPTEVGTPQLESLRTPRGAPVDYTSREANVASLSIVDDAGDADDTDLDEGPASVVDSDDLTQPLISIEEACQLFGLKRPAFVKAIKNGSLPYTKIAPKAGSSTHLGHTFSYRLRLPDVERWHKEIYSKLPPPKRGRPTKTRR